MKVQLLLHTNNKKWQMMNNTTSSATNHIPTILGEILYGIGYFVLALLIMVLIIWIFLLIQFIWENQKKIQRQIRTNENYETLVCEKIEAAKSDIVKLRLMIVVIVFELLTCISIIFGLIGDQISIWTKIRTEMSHECIPFATKFKIFVNKRHDSQPSYNVMSRWVSGHIISLHGQSIHESKYKDTRHKIHDDIDHCTGSNYCSTWSDRSNILYSSVFICDIQHSQLYPVSERMLEAGKTAQMEKSGLQLHEAQS